MRDRKINSFAIRSFRDIADKDYIAARLAFRADLLPQFLWAGEQAFEKYLKAILCFYRIPAPKVGHNISRLLELSRRLPFRLEFSKASLRVLDLMGAYGPYRYLERAWHVTGHFLPQFDWAIWELRRHCQAINHDALDPSGADPAVMASIRLSDALRPTAFKILSGHLEDVIEKTQHPSRPGLIWNNPCYGLRQRTTIGSAFKMNAANPPLLHHPEILDDVEKLVYIPEAVKRACREHWLPPRDGEPAQ